MDMDRLFVAQFHYDGFVTPMVKHLYEEAYNLMRNKACDLLNPMYETWNNEYGEIEDQDDYYRYICEKQQVILDELNKQFNESPVKLYASKDRDIVGKFTDVLTKKEVTMYVTVKPLKPLED